MYRATITTLRLAPVARISSAVSTPTSWRAALALLSLAILAASAYSDQPSWTGNTGPKASDYAQAVPFAMGDAISTSRRARMGYRLILPVSAAMFLTSFSVWSLQSIRNRAVEPLSHRWPNG